MRNKKIKIFLTSLLFFVLCLPVYAGGLQNAFNTSGALGDVAGEAGYDTSQEGVLPIIKTIIQVALSFLGVIFLILVIYGGFLWMTASGNEEQVGKAKKILKSAIIGLVIVMMSYAISWFVTNALGENALQDDESSSGESQSLIIVKNNC